LVIKKKFITMHGLMNVQSKILDWTRDTT